MIAAAVANRKDQSRALQNSSVAITFDYQIPSAISAKFEALRRDGAEPRARTRLPEPQVGVSVSEDGARNFPRCAEGQQRLFNLYRKRSIRRSGEAQGVHLVTSPLHHQQKKGADDQCQTNDNQYLLFATHYCRFYSLSNFNSSSLLFTAMDKAKAVIVGVMNVHFAITPTLISWFQIYNDTFGL